MNMFLMAKSIGSYIQDAMATLFLTFFDKVAYFLLYSSYNVFLAVSELNVFGGDVEAANLIYDTFTKRLYTVLGIVMIFFFSYQMLLMIANPEGDGAKATSKIVKDAVISLIFIAISPTIFNYMAILQTHVVKDQTMIRLVVGQGGETEDPGKSIVMIVFMSMFHPEGTNYNTFVNTDGTLRDEDDAVSDCESSADSDICEAWYDGMVSWAADDSASIKPITKTKKLREAIGDDGGTEYNWILCTGVAIAVAWFFLSYALDLGTRAVKLGFLQIITPIPLVMRIFPQTKKSYDTWFKEIMTTYVEIFVRLLAIAFIIELCILVPDFIKVIFGANDNVNGSPAIQGIATVCLVLGMLNFAKDAPKLFKDIFSAGGLFDGFNLKPGVMKRVNDTPGVKQATSAVTGAVGGGIGSAVKGFVSAKREAEKRGDTDPGKAFWAGVRGGAKGVVRGTVGGAVNGAKNAQDVGVKGTVNGFKNGIDSGQAAVEKRQHAYDASNAKTAVGKYIASSFVGQKTGEFVEGVKGVGKQLVGTQVTVDEQTRQILQNMVAALNRSKEQLEDGDTIKAMKKAQEDMLKDFAKGKEVSIQERAADGTVSTRTFTSTDEIKDYYKKAIQAEKRTAMKDANSSERINAQTNIGAVAEMMKKNPSAINKELMADLQAAFAGIHKDLKVEKNGQIDVAATLEKISQGKENAATGLTTDEITKALETALSTQSKIKSSVSIMDNTQNASQSLNPPKPDKPSGGDKPSK